MVKTRKSTKEDYKHIEKVIEPLGFKQTAPGMFHHKLLDRLFDFTACSVEGVIYTIFADGLDKGIKDTKKDLRVFLGIEETNPFS